MKLKIKAENGGKSYGFTITKDVFLDLVSKAFDDEVAEQAAWVKEPVKAGGFVPSMLLSFGVTTAKTEKYEAESGEVVYPESGKEFTEGNAKQWLAANNFTSETRGKPLTEEQKAARKLKAAGQIPLEDLMKLVAEMQAKQGM